MSSLPQTLRHTVQLYGDQEATRMGDRSRTWRQMQDRVARLAGGWVSSW